MAQSSNDNFPSAMYIAAARRPTPAEYADIGFAATPAPTGRTGTSYTLELADDERCGGFPGRRPH